MEDEDKPIEQETLPPDSVAESMTIDEPMEQTWLGQFWGVIFMIVLVGTIIGLPLWWIWGRSPLLPWLKITLSVILLAILYIII